MNIFARFAVFAALTAFPVSAWATGNVGCSVDDANMNFAFEALFGYGSDAPLMQVRSDIEVKQDKVPASLRKIAMDGSYLKQQWFVGRDLKLLLLAETKDSDPAYGSVKLIIEANQPPDEDFAYDGTYRLELQNGSNENEPVILTGKIECSAG